MLVRQFTDPVLWRHAFYLWRLLMISVDEALSEIVRGADSVISMEGLKAKLE